MGMAPVLDDALAGSSFVLAPETIFYGTCRHVMFSNCYLVGQKQKIYISHQK